MARWLVIILGVLGFCWKVAGNNKYDNYTLMQITPYNVRQLKALTKLSTLGSDEVNVLKSSHGLKDTTDVLVSSRKKVIVEKLAISHGMTVQFINHYGRFFDGDSSYLRTSKSDDYNMYDYNSYDAMTKRILTIAEENPKLVTLQTLGKSYEGRETRLVKISANTRARNPIIFIDAGAHAREWVAPALAMYLIERLARGARMLDGVDWYILPLVNPDGYEYTRKDQSNRMWRKTRSKTMKKGCMGVDINRNYGFKWGVSGVSFDPCDFQTYAGPKPFSEPESRMVREVMKTYSELIKLYVSIHAYGQYLVYPWGYTGEALPSTSKKLHRLAQLYSKTVEKMGGKPFKVMNSGRWYPSSGGSDDYAFGDVKIPYVYTLEITDDYEFIFPPKLLRTALPLYYEGFKTFASEIKKEFGERKLKGNLETEYSSPNIQNSQCELGS